MERRAPSSRQWGSRWGGRHSSGLSSIARHTGVWAAGPSGVLVSSAFVNISASSAERGWWCRRAGVLRGEVLESPASGVSRSTFPLGCGSGVRAPRSIAGAHRRNGGVRPPQRVRCTGESPPWPVQPRFCLGYGEGGWGAPDGRRGRVPPHFSGSRDQKLVEPCRGEVASLRGRSGDTGLSRAIRPGEGARDRSRSRHRARAPSRRASPAVPAGLLVQAATSTRSGRGVGRSDGPQRVSTARWAASEGQTHDA